MDEKNDQIALRRMRSRDGKSSGMMTEIAIRQRHVVPCNSTIRPGIRAGVDVQRYPVLVPGCSNPLSSVGEHSGPLDVALPNHPECRCQISFVAYAIRRSL